MEPASSLVDALDGLSGLNPVDYFQGVRPGDLCQVDNLIVFLRRERAVLFESGFITRPHHRFVLILNFSTPGTLNVDGVAYRLHPGEAFLIAPYQLHLYMDVAEPAIRWLFFTFEAVRREPFEAFLNLPIALGEAEQAEALRLTQAYSRIALSGPVSREGLILGVSLFLTRLKQRALRGRSAAAARGSDLGLVERINRLLRWHLAEGLSIAALAGRLALSESHLRKCFRQVTGMSLGHYLLHYRLNRAIKLLVHSELSVTEIALECGYESLAAFSRAFRNKLGETPSSFRRAGRENAAPRAKEGR